MPEPAAVQSEASVLEQTEMPAEDNSDRRRPQSFRGLFEDLWRETGEIWYTGDQETEPES